MSRKAVQLQTLALGTHVTDAGLAYLKLLSSGHKAIFTEITDAD